MVGNQSPTVYIVLGVFNPSLPLFEKQLRSLLTQEFKSLKILLILDGPQAEEVTSLARSFSDERIMLVPHSANVGVHEILRVASEPHLNKAKMKMTFLHSVTRMMCGTRTRLRARLIC